MLKTLMSPGFFKCNPVWIYLVGSVRSVTKNKFVSIESFKIYTSRPDQQAIQLQFQLVSNQGYMEKKKDSRRSHINLGKIISARHEFFFLE